MGENVILKAIEQIADERGISREIIIESFKQAMINAYQKIMANKEIKVRVDLVGNQVKVFHLKEVVEDADNEDLQMSLEDAKNIDPNLNIGDVIEIPVSVDEEYNRMAALHVKQVLKQKIREAEKQVLYEYFLTKVGEIIEGKVESIEQNGIVLSIANTTLMLTNAHTIPNEKYHKYYGKDLKVYVVKVEKSTRGPQVLISRTDPGFLKRLFEREIVEVYDGTVEIKAIARDPGERSKVAVFSRNSNVDAPGACIGPKGMRIRNVSEQVAGEKIDVINYSEHPELYIAEALKPAEVLGMKIDKESKSSVVIVPNGGLSLAIGKKGQNARLAARLTDWKIDIKEVDAALDQRIEYVTMAEIKIRIEQEEKLKELKKYGKIEEEIIPEVEEEIIETEEEILDPVEEVEIPQSEVLPKEEEIVETKEETPEVEEEVETVEIITPTQPTISLAELEKEIERERRRSQQSSEGGRFRRFKDKDKDKAKSDSKDSKLTGYQMPVYSQEELEELENAEHDDDINEFDDINFEDYEEYYD